MSSAKRNRRAFRRRFNAAAGVLRADAAVATEAAGQAFRQAIAQMPLWRRAALAAQIVCGRLR